MTWTPEPPEPAIQSYQSDHKRPFPTTFTVPEPASVPFLFRSVEQELTLFFLFFFFGRPRRSLKIILLIAHDHAHPLKHSALPLLSVLLRRSSTCVLPTYCGLLRPTAAMSVSMRLPRLGVPLNTQFGSHTLLTTFQQTLDTSTHQQCNPRPELELPFAS